MNEPESQQKTDTPARRARRQPAVPPPDSEIWPEQYRGKRWKRIYAILFAGNCLLCTHSWPLPRATRLLSKWAGLPYVLLCANCPDRPGELLDVLPTETCRNFRPKRWKAAAAAQTQPGPSPADPAESDPTVRRIFLGHGLFATVDAADFEELNKD